MSAEVIELKQESNSSLPVTQQDVDNLKRQRELLREFVSSQMREADFSDKNSESYGSGDYGIIPGTKKKCLFKPGAEKLLRVFNLGARVRLVDKEIDRHANFAIYTYRAEIYNLRTSAVIAECEGVANSQEVKYKERTVWRKNAKGISESIKEETPIFDVLNTLMKMAQKRAIIGATILATSASDYFSSDIEDAKDAEAVGIKARVDKPNEKEVKSEVIPGDAPLCCEQPMMISKFMDKELDCMPFYCLKCKAKKAR